jgi:hypothetical protein
MRTVLLFVTLLGPSCAWACDAIVVQASVGLVFAANQPVLPSLDTGLNCGVGRSETLPMFGAHGRLTLQRDFRLLGQLGLSAGVLLPHTIGAQLEVGLIGDNGVVRPTVGASAWAAPFAEPFGQVSPRLGAAWTRFKRDGAAHDWLSVSGGVAAVGSLRPVDTPLTSHN